jgi:phosphoribosylaminoimidazolecarboxamide formyltransferase/IMP cyclohydrolase
LLSVTNKTGIVEFARSLQARGWDIMSTGGTAELLRQNDIDVIGVSYYTGMPEVFGGRVKTLHPKIHGGLLAKPEDVKHQEEMEALNIRTISLLTVNLYDFETAALSQRAHHEIIEQIDIGGPAMIRAAAKNADNVLVIVDPDDYEKTLLALDHGVSNELRKKLQAKAFAHTAAYDATIASWLQRELPTEIGAPYCVGLRLSAKMRYGENPHQIAALFSKPLESQGAAAAKQLWGKPLSYNNVLDADAAWELVWDIHKQIENCSPCVIIKHGNPCGVSWDTFAVESFHGARVGDPISAFGGIVAFAGSVGLETAKAIIEKGNFFEVVIATDFTTDALEQFKNRSGWGQNVRLLSAPIPQGSYLQLRGLRGAVLAQSSDHGAPESWEVVTLKRPSEHAKKALRAAWVVAKHVKSNAIVIANTERVVGVGAGQMNRVGAARIALENAGEAAKGAVLASDGFFPFPDSIEVAAGKGIIAIIQPGGSKADSDVIEAANRLGITMVFTGVRHFRH